MSRLLNRTPVLNLFLAFALLFVSTSAFAQYHGVYLDSHLAGQAPHIDPLLKNAWGLAYAPTGPFWISDEATGWSTLYDGMGNPQSLQVIVPPATGTGPGSPTGIVYNGSQEFQINTWASVFL